MEFKDIVHTRYAAKGFSAKKVPQEKIDQLIELIRHAPSSFNIQPWKIMIITDQKVKDELQKISWNQPQVGTCSHLLVFCADTHISSNIDKIEKVVKVPQYISMMRDFEKSKSSEFKVAWAQRQLYIALDHAMLGAASLGLDSCPMEGFDADAYTKMLKIPTGIVPTVLLPIGFASDKPRGKFRFEKKDIILSQ
jgi:nitroreductase